MIRKLAKSWRQFMIYWNLKHAKYSESALSFYEIQNLMIDNKRFYRLMTIRQQMLKLKSLPIRFPLYDENNLKHLIIFNIKTFF